MRVPSRPVGRGLTFNITPLIDVVFLLNIFFLVATYYITNEPAAAVDLPGATLAEKEDDVASRLIVTVLPDGTLSLAGVEISLSDVNREISLMMTEHGPEQSELRIRADKATPYRFVEPLLLAAARQGVTRVRYAVVTTAGGN
jgi:biopolymer transport protein ExbD